MANYPIVCRILLSTDKLLRNCRSLCNIRRQNSKILSKSNNNTGCCFSTSTCRAMYATNNLFMPSSNEDSENSLPLRYIYVRTSVRYWYENPDGLLFDVGYIDTHPMSLDKSQLTIVGIPNLLGNHNDLVPVLSAFSKVGYRVVIPNFPGGPYVKGIKRADDGFFTYSVEEKAMFVADFLAEVGVHSVDLFVTDGYGMYTAMQLCCDQKDKYKAIAMINPKGLNTTAEMQPERLFKQIAQSWDVQFKRPMIQLHLFVWRYFIGKRHWSVSELVWLARSLKGLSFPTNRAIAYQCSPEEIPRLFMYSSQDKYVQDIEEMLEESGVPKDDFTVYDENDNLVCEGKNNDVCTGIVFGSSLDDSNKVQLKTVKTKLYQFLQKIAPTHKL